MLNLTDVLEQLQNDDRSQRQEMALEVVRMHSCIEHLAHLLDTPMAEWHGGMRELARGSVDGLRAYAVALGRQLGDSWPVSQAVDAADNVTA